MNITRVFFFFSLPPPPAFFFVETNWRRWATLECPEWVPDGEDFGLLARLLFPLPQSTIQTWSFAGFAMTWKRLRGTRSGVKETHQQEWQLNSEAVVEVYPDSLPGRISTCEKENQDVPKLIPLLGLASDWGGGEHHGKSWKGSPISSCSAEGSEIQAQITAPPPQKEPPHA